MSKRLLKVLCLLILSFFLSQCKKNAFDEHYERPEWLKGNAWELLEQRGDFSIFLRGAERAGFKDILTGKGIATVIAPNDDAFKAYFQEKGIGSVDEMEIGELKKLIGYHLVYYAFNKAGFSNYQPEGFENLQPAYAGLYYKHRTRSRDTLTFWKDLAGANNKRVFHKDRFLPVISSTLFSTKGIDAKTNYEYFYPNSQWSGDGGFNISNATVNEYALPSDNGYVYIVDQVLEPLETVHKELKGLPDYSLFMSAYDRFIDFWYDESATLQYASPGDSLFVVKHGILPQIASEWSYNGESGFPDFGQLADLSYKAFNVFAPNNDALNQFFDQYWSEYYPSFNDVEFLPLAYLLYNHVYQGNIVFPSEIVQGDHIRSEFGNPIKFDPFNDVAHKGIGVNGVYYGLNKAIVPPVFTSVTGPVLRNPDYKLFLYMLANTGLLQPLMSDALKYTLLIPTNETILSTLYGESYMFWNEGNPLKFGDEALEVENSDGIRVPMSQRSMELFVSNHIIMGEIEENAGNKVYRTRNPFSYLYVKDGRIASSGVYNAGEFIGTANVPGDWSNGKAYEVETSMLREAGSLKFSLTGSNSSSSNLYEFSEFGKLLSRAGLLEPGEALSFLFGDNFLLFAPSNEAIIEALNVGGIIPEGGSELADYLKYYFVPVSDNSLNDYPFPGFGVQGDFTTAMPLGFAKRSVALNDMGNSLQLRSDKGETASVLSEFPKIFNDGAIYRIDKVFKLK